MSKLICFAGVSRVNGVLKFRGAQSAARITQLRKLGDTDVEMRFLNTEMTKSQAAKRLIATDFAQGRADVLALLVSVANDDNPFKAKKARVVKVKVPNKAMVHLVGAKVETEELSTKEARKIRDAWNRKHAHLSYDGE